jgi:hypothetical protein
MPLVDVRRPVRPNVRADMPAVGADHAHPERPNLRAEPRTRFSRAANKSKKSPTASALIRGLFEEIGGDKEHIIAARVLVPVHVFTPSAVVSSALNVLELPSALVTVSMPF